MSNSACVTNANTYIYDWLARVNARGNVETLQRIKEADSNYAKQSLEKNKVYNFFFSWLPLHNKEKKSNWKIITVIPTAVARVSIFVYASFFKAAEGAENYLQNTENIKKLFPLLERNKNPDKSLHNKISRLVQIQLRIDESSLDKITNYKEAVLAGLVGTIIVAGGALAYAAIPWWVATAGIIAAIVGGALDTIAVVYAAYNYGTHWSDEKDAKKELSSIKNETQDLIKVFSQSQDFFDEFKAIYNQRRDPKKAYPSLYYLVPCITGKNDLKVPFCYEKFRKTNYLRWVIYPSSLIIVLGMLSIAHAVKSEFRK